MKALITLALMLVLFSCKKDDRAIGYNVNGGQFWISYVNKSEVVTQVYAHGTAIVDSAMIGGVVVYDTLGYTTTHWSDSFDAKADFAPHITVRVDKWDADVSMSVDGVTTAHDVTRGYQGPVVLP